MHSFLRSAPRSGPLIIGQHGGKPHLATLKPTFPFRFSMSACFIVALIWLNLSFAAQEDENHYSVASLNASSTTSARLPRYFGL